MGAICSKKGDTTGGHTVLSSSPQPSGGGAAPLSADSARPANPRQAAAAAAEARAKSAQERNSGPLGAKLAAANRAKRVPEQREEERLVWD